MTYTFWSSNTGGGPTPPDPGSISQSLRFRGAQFLNRANLGGSSEFTISFWFKSAHPSSGNHTSTFFQSSGTGLDINYPANCWIQDRVGSFDSRPRLTRDVSAWYHLVYQYSATNGQRNIVWINGEEWINVTGVDRAYSTGEWVIGAVSGGTSPFEGYMADYYQIDGQLLLPTAFGRFNEDGVWVPREVDFAPADTNGIIKYSNYVYYSSSTSSVDFNTTDPLTDNSGPTSRAFNGNLNDKSTTTNANTGWVWRPPNLTAQSSFRVYLGNFGGAGTTQTLYLNEVEVVPETQYATEQWVDVGAGQTYPLNITNFAAKGGNYNGAGRAGGYIAAIEVDGEILLDPYMWSTDLISSTGAFSGTPANAFDGNPNTLCGANSNAPGTTLTWAPSKPISFTQKVEVVVNQDNTASYGTNTAVQGVPGDYITLFEGSGVIDAANPIVSYASPGVSYPYFYAFRIDGQVYVDGANPSYGANGFHLTFQDPDNLGLDTSGNGNNFTATGFVTERPANYTHSSTGSSNLNSYPNEANGVNAPFMEPSSYVYYSPAGAQSFIYDFHSPIVVTGSLEVIAQGSMDQSAGYGSNTVTIEYSDGSTTVSNFSDLTSPPVNSSTPGYITVSSPGDAITKIIVDNPAPAPAINGGFAGLKINGNKLLLSTTVSAADYDLMQDGPSQNYATINPLYPYTTTAVISDADLYYKENTGNAFSGSTFGTQELTGKNYWEVTVHAKGNTYPNIGIGDVSVSPYFDPGNNWTFNTAYCEGYGWTGGGIMEEDDRGAWVEYVAGDTIGLAYDAATRKLTFTKNGGDAKTVGIKASAKTLVTSVQSAQNAEVSINYGQQPFLYAPPEGFSGLQTQNMKEVTIKDGHDHFAAVTYNGKGGTQSISSLEFQPDFVWIKDRDQGKSNVLFDSVRGPLERIMSNSTAEETPTAGTLISFDTNGFTVGSNTGVNDANGSGYVAWCWKGGGAAVTNNDGDIESQVSANPAAGFSVVKYTGDGSKNNVGHGLSKPPEMVLVKPLSNAAWVTYHEPLGINSWLNLNTETGNGANDIDNYWGNGMTSTTIGVYQGGSGNNNLNNIGMVAYCWHSVPGYSSFGSYKGNDSTNGPFIYTGFRPAFVMFKNTSSGFWQIRDSTRDPYNPSFEELYPNVPDKENTHSSTRYIDLLSNGFKLRASDSPVNGNTIVYAAFSENPFGGSNVSPANAR